MLAGGVILDHRLDCFAGWHVCLDCVEKGDELLMPMALHIAVDDCAVEGVGGSKERGRSQQIIF